MTASGTIFAASASVGSFCCRSYFVELSLPFLVDLAISMGMVAHTLVLLSGFAVVERSVQDVAPVIIPARPKPFFSWATIPTAFHGANRSGVYTDEAVKLLARNQMVTIEKWFVLYRDTCCFVL
jgi:hypothetical protein